MKRIHVTLTIVHLAVWCSSTFAAFETTLPDQAVYNEPFLESKQTISAGTGSMYLRSLKQDNARSLGMNKPPTARTTKPTAKPISPVARTKKPAKPTVKPISPVARTKKPAKPPMNPAKGPTKSPTKSPTKRPTKFPTKRPTKFPTKPPTLSPTNPPTKAPTNPPTKSPTNPPTKTPTRAPTKSPTKRPTGAPLKTLLDVIGGTPNLSTLKSMMEQGTDLSTGKSVLSVYNTLNGTAYTLFAPSNDAFAAFNQTFLNMLLTPSYSSHLRQFLYGHITGGRAFYSQLQAGITLSTNTFSITSNATAGVVSLYNSNLGIKLASVTETRNLFTANGGVVHVIDAVMKTPILDITVNAYTAPRPDLSTFTSLVTKAGLAEILETVTLTVFTPRNAGFAAVPKHVLDYLNATVDTLREVLLYHFVPGVYPWEQLSTTNLTTLQGTSIRVSAPQGLSPPAAALNSKSVNGVLFRSLNAVAANGIVHVMESVLFPPNLTLPFPTIKSLLESTPNLSTLAAAAKLAREPATGRSTLDLISSSIGPFTWFVPSNDAFAALNQTLWNMYLTPPYAEHLRNFLYLLFSRGVYYYAQLEAGVNVSMLADGVSLTSSATNGVVSLNFTDNKQASVTETRDVLITTGVVHVIDQVVIAGILAQTLYTRISQQTFTTIAVSLFVKAGLDGILRTDTVTFLCPIDTAFNAVPRNVMDYLNANVDVLRQVLTYHLLPGVYPWNLIDTGDFMTVQGSFIHIDAPQGASRPAASSTSKSINNTTKFAGLDGVAMNGIIHPITGVLIPPNITLPTTTNSSPTKRPTAAPLKTLVGLLETTPNLSTFKSLMEQSTDIYTGNSQLHVKNTQNSGFTLFAPPNDAFAAFNQTLLNMLLTPPYSVHLRQLVEWHVLVVRSDYLELQAGITVISPAFNFTSNATAGVVSLYNSNLGIKLASLTETRDLFTSNGGVVHVVDAVMRPPFLDMNLFRFSVSRADLSTFTSLVTMAGLDEILRTDTLTVFVPTNAGFAAVPKHVLDYLNGNVDALREVLLYHFVSGLYPWEQLNTTNLTTLQGTSIRISAPRGLAPPAAALDSKSVNNNVPFRFINFAVANGLAHVIDFVLFPPNLTLPFPTFKSIIESSPSLSTLAAAATLAREPSSGKSTLETLSAQNGPFTWFMPSNDAFAALNQTLWNMYLTPPYAEHLRNLLFLHLSRGVYYHAQLEVGLNLSMVGAGASLTSNATDGVVSLYATGVKQASVTETRDVLATTGVVHIIDRAMIAGILVQTLYVRVSRQSFASIALSLFVTAGLDGILRTDTVTLLCPINAAFNAVPSYVMDYLNANVDVLRQVLTYHLLPSVYPWQLFDTGDFMTVQGSLIHIDAPQGALQPAASTTSKSINNTTKFANLDGVAMNGIFHPITGVLIPPNITLPTSPT